MLSFLQLYTSRDRPGWHASLLLAATAAGKGQGLARSLCKWVWEYLEDNTQLPVSHYGKHQISKLEDEDLAEEFHLYLQSLNKKFLLALDVVQYFEHPEVQSQFNLKNAPSDRTARCWMHIMKSRYGKAPNGMYVDGHEQEDVVAYHMDIFLPFWVSIEDWMLTWTNEISPSPLMACQHSQKKKTVSTCHSL